MMKGYRGGKRGRTSHGGGVQEGKTQAVANGLTLGKGRRQKEEVKRGIRAPVLDGPQDKRAGQRGPTVPQSSSH